MFVLTVVFILQVKVASANALKNPQGSKSYVASQNTQNAHVLPQTNSHKVSSMTKPTLPYPTLPYVEIAHMQGRHISSGQNIKTKARHGGEHVHDRMKNNELRTHW